MAKKNEKKADLESLLKPGVTWDEIMDFVNKESKED